MISRVSVRKTLHDYAIPISATILFIVIFVGLWITHQYALASVRDLANTNPLIVSDKNKLISNDHSTDPVIEQFSDSDTSQANSQSANSSTPGTSNPSQSSTPQSSASSTKPNGTAPSAQPSSPRAPFATSLGTIEDHTTRVSTTVTLLGIVLGCTVDHQFKISVAGQNGPGTMKYRWVRSNGGDSAVEQATFPTGNSSVELTHTMTTSKWGDYSVTLEVSTPVAMEKKYSFSHKC